MCAAKRVDDKPTKGGKKKTKDAKSKAEPEPEPADDNDSSEKDTPADKAAAAEEAAEEDLLADLSYTVELAAGETVFLPFHWRIRSTASSGGSVEPLGEFAPLDMAQLLGARPLPHGAVFAAEVGLLHAVGSGRTSVDPSQPEDCAAAAGRVKVSGGGKLGVVSRLIVQLLPRPLVVDEALPLYGIEHGMLHTSIPLPAERMPAWRRGTSSSSAAATDGSADFRSWRVVCTDASVGARIAWGADASSAGGGGGGAEIQLQTRCGVATQTPKVCYLFLYANEAAAAAGTGNNTAAGCVSAVIQLLLHTACAPPPPTCRLPNFYYYRCPRQPRVETDALELWVCTCACACACARLQSGLQRVRTLRRAGERRLAAAAAIPCQEHNPVAALLIGPTTA